MSRISCRLLYVLCITALILPALPLSAQNSTSGANAFKIVVPRANFIRGEVIPVSVQGGASELRLEDSSGKLLMEYKAKPSSEDALFKIDSKTIASGRYRLATGSDGKRVENEITIVPAKPEGFPFGICCGISLRSRKDIDNKAKKMSEYNINLLQLHSWEVFNFPLLLDTCTKYGIEFMPIANVYYNRGIAANYPEERMKYSDGKDRPDWYAPGMPISCFLSLHDREKAKSLLKEQIDSVKPYPSYKKRMLIGDDVCMLGDHGRNLMVCYCDNCKKKFKELTGFDAPAFTPDILNRRGIISDKDPWYLWMKFRCSNVMGDYQKFLMSEAEKLEPGIKLGPTVQPIFEPFEGTNPADFLKSFTLNSSYCYPVYHLPSWEQLLHTDLMSMDNRDGKDISIVAQAVEADTMLNFLGPCGWIKEAEDRGEPVFEYTSGKTTADGRPYAFKAHFSAAYYRTEFYSLLAGGAKMITWFGAPAHENDYDWDELKALGDVAKKYGSVFLNLKREPAKVGLFASFTAHSFEVYDEKNGERDPWTSVNALQDAYATLQQAQIPTETVSEEEILSGRLKNYKVVILPNILVMRESVCRKLEEYIKNGGTVYYDTSTAVRVKGAKPLDLDFTDWFRYLMDNNYKRAWWDALPFHRLKAEALKQGLCGIDTPFATSPSSDLIIKEHSACGVKYLWVINADMKNPKEAVMRLKGKHLHINDLLACKFLPSFYQQKKDTTEFVVGLAPGAGKLLAIYPEGISKVESAIPSKAKRGDTITIRTSVLGRSGKTMPGIQPLKVTITSPDGSASEYGGYYGAESGRKDITFTLAQNDKAGKWTIEVTELGSGQKCTNTLVVE